jgi:fatty-acyl-CoA synthase
MKTIDNTIGRQLQEVARNQPAQAALVHTETGIRYDYGRLIREIEQTARGFLQAGIGPGDRVALWAPNLAEWELSFLGLASLGAVTVPVDPTAPAETLNYILTQSECSGLVISPEDSRIETARRARQAVPSLRHIFLMAPEGQPDMLSWSGLMAGGASVHEHVLGDVTRSLCPKDPVAIMYTSGTTGPPKGVVLDHLGLINKSMHATERQKITSEDRLCLFFPLFHMFGNTCIALAGLLRGAALIMPCRTFDPARILRTIAAEGCTAIYGSPSMFIALINHPSFRKADWSALAKGIIGGAPCPMELMRQIVEDLRVSNITVAWGITEASSWITMTHPQDPIELRVSTIGTSLPCNEVKIVDPYTGAILPANRPGELCTRGYLMKHYYKMPAATAAAIDADGWFHTGDLGLMDERGYVKITGRLKDVIVRDGVEIYPIDVEEVIYTLPAVSEVQVFGFPHPHKGQEVAAWVKLKPGAQLTAEVLAEHVARHVAPEKYPRHYKFVDAFPMTGSGKIQKYKLAELAQKEYLGQ